MSEYQWFEFIAIDGPVSGDDLEFMEEQSSRANVTPWHFTNEYHYGDFRGNADEMLRRGYDMHFHFANYGIRKLMIRLPHGLPCDKRTFNKYAVDYGVTWTKDKRGKAGILEIQPESDAGTFDYLMDVQSVLDELRPLRAMLMAGDLRPLFLAWLICCWEEDAAVPPIPAGLNELDDALHEMINLYEMDSDWLAAVAAESQPLPSLDDTQTIVDRWLAKRKKADLTEIVRSVLLGEASREQARLLANIRADHGQVLWPTSKVKMKLRDVKQFD